MAADVEPPPPHPEAGNSEESGARTSCCLHKFRLYETRSKFYIIGRDKSSTFWKMLKIDRLKASELNIHEDPAAYSESESRELLKRIHEDNMSTGGLRFVTNCYGIVGFVKFLGPFYMLIITKRRQIGIICGHTVYAITKSKMILLPNSSERPDIPIIKNENRYKKLLSAVDLTKDFFFSYSYHIMRSLQKNYQDNSQTGQLVYDTMFVWNEFLTRGIRSNLKNTIWTVALVHGFFRQDKISISGKDFMLTLIARRSRHYAGTRYLKRGVNEKGRVANDVETEQIVYKDVPGGCPDQITSIVQNRGSIPLYWSQETSKLNLKPDIVLQRKDQRYEATRLHFENLVKRYGNPIIILNLIKTNERKPRESKLRAEFAKAIDLINNDLSTENRLKFLHWDLNKHSRRAANVLALLSKVAANALTLTGFFYCQPTPALRLEDSLELPFLGDGSFATWSCKIQNNRKEGNADVLGDESQEESAVPQNNCIPTFQSGVLRTNCIDCLDRTNVAQYAYGLTALGHQLYTLGLIDVPKIDLNDPLADELMSFYETMGDTLAVQYTGSAAHNKIFSERRGHWKATIQSQEFLRTLQRYYNNAYMDAEKQDAINLFLGHFQPQHGKPALWELDSDQHCSNRRWGNAFVENSRSFVKRSLSDGNILSEPDSSISGTNCGLKKVTDLAMPDRTLLQDESKCLSESSPEISSCDSDISYSRYTHMVVGRQLFVDNNQRTFFNENGADGSDCSNFLDFDSLSSSGNSCEDEIYERSSLIHSPVGSPSTESINGRTIEMSPQLSTRGSSIRISQETSSSETALFNYTSDFPKQFVDWVMHGETFYL